MSGKRGRLQHGLFRAGVALKGVDAVVETAGGLALWCAPPGWLLRGAALATQAMVSSDPHDPIARWLMQLARHFSFEGHDFAVAYLIGHGAVKMLIVAALLRSIRWAYPLSGALLLAFTGYELYRFTLSHSYALLAGGAFDLAVVVLIWLEYRALPRSRQSRTRE